MGSRTSTRGNRGSRSRRIRGVGKERVTRSKRRRPPTGSTATRVAPPAIIQDRHREPRRLRGHMTGRRVPQRRQRPECLGRPPGDFTRSPTESGRHVAVPSPRLPRGADEPAARSSNTAASRPIIHARHGPGLAGHRVPDPRPPSVVADEPGTVRRYAARREHLRRQQIRTTSDFGCSTPTSAAPR